MDGWMETSGQTFQRWAVNATSEELSTASGHRSNIRWHPVVPWERPPTLLSDPRWSLSSLCQTSHDGHKASPETWEEEDGGFCKDTLRTIPPPRLRHFGPDIITFLETEQICSGESTSRLPPFPWTFLSLPWRTVARMWTLALLTLGVFACNVCSAHLLVHSEFKPRKVSGTWYPIQLVMDGGEMADVNIVKRTAVIMANGDINMHVESRRDGVCTTKVTTFIHTEVPEKFVTEKGSIIEVFETDYATYCILLVKTKDLRVLHLEGRRRSVPIEVKMQFKSIAASEGFPVHKIINVPKTKPCFP